MENQQSQMKVDNDNTANIEATEFVPLKYWLLLYLIVIPVIGQLFVFGLIVYWGFKEHKSYKYPCLINYARACFVFIMAYLVFGATCSFLGIISFTNAFNAVIGALW